MTRSRNGPAAFPTLPGGPRCNGLAHRAPDFRRHMRVAIDETLQQRRLLGLRDGRDRLANGIVGDCSAIRVRRPLGRCSNQVRIDDSASSSALSSSPSGLSTA